MAALCTGLAAVFASFAEWSAGSGYVLSQPRGGAMTASFATAAGSPIPPAVSPEARGSASCDIRRSSR